MKKVVFVGLYYLDKGGNAALRRAYGLIDLLPKNSVDVSLLGYSQHGCDIVKPTECKLYNISYSNKLDIYFRFKKMLETLESLNIKKGDALILYNPPAYILFRVKKYAKSKEINLIVDITESYAYSFNLIKSLDTFVRMEWLLKKQDNIISVSDYLFKKYKNNKLHKNIIKIPTLVNKSSQKLPYDNRGQYVFSFIGTISKKKERLDLALEAFSYLYNEKKVSNFILNIVGPSREQIIHVYPRLKKVLSGRFLDKINFHGILSQKKASNVLICSDYSMIIRDSNKVTEAGCPTKLFEAIANSIPVFITKFGGIEEYIDQDFDVLIGETNLHNIIEKLERALMVDYKRFYIDNKLRLSNENRLEMLKSIYRASFNNIIEVTSM